MKKKATLLIVNIVKIYTMNDAMNHEIEILNHAFLAIHHDSILACGEGDFRAYIDKDTRIIDGSNQIVVPGFIDAHAGFYPVLPNYVKPDEKSMNEYIKTASLGDLTRKMKEMAFIMLSHGVTTIVSDEGYFHPTILSLIQNDVRFECYQKEPNTTFLSNKNLGAIKKDNHCISCEYHPIKQPCLDILFTARAHMLFQQYSAIEILQALTFQPAISSGLTHIGKIDVGMQADVLLLQGRSIEEVLSHIMLKSITSVIKKGIHIYPNVII